MDPRLQLRVQRYGWDAASDFYEDGWRGPLAPAHATLLRTADLRADDRVLEAACGSGMVTTAIADAVGSTGAVLATDLSQKMVDLTAQRCAERGLSWVRAARMSADDLAVAEGSYHAALCALGLMYVPDPGLALGSMRRAVTTDGRVVATVWGERRNCGWAELFPIIDARVASEVCPMFFATGAPGALRDEFERAGLIGITEHRHVEVLEFSGERALLLGMLHGGPLALAVKRFTPEVLAEAGEEFLASVAAHRTPDGRYRIPGEFVTVMGRRSA